MRIYIGYDKREAAAFEVCRRSIVRHLNGPRAVHIEGIEISDLRARKVYWRDEDRLASTDFTYTRFLVPYLAGYKGWALFMDCDMLVRGNVAELFELTRDWSKTVWCVQHDYTPKETVKMDGAAQTQYPRKNWSSVMMINCERARTLTPERVNAASGAHLHQMQWCKDEEIGALPLEWNWLEGWNTRAECPDPKIVHMTRGGPWFPNWEHVDYADEWRAAAA
jgi:hypothetical protein